jgi:hypothetical protein
VTHLRAWREPVPIGIIALAAAVTIGGGAAAILAHAPVLLITSPLIGVLLGGAAVLAPLRVRMLHQLPQSRARDLLIDLLRRADIVASRAQVKPLVAAACEAARQLSVLEAHLELGADERCRRSKEILERRLQNASAALTRWEASEAWQIEAELAEQVEALLA